MLESGEMFDVRIGDSDLEIPNIGSDADDGIQNGFLEPKSRDDHPTGLRAEVVQAGQW